MNIPDITSALSAQILGVSGKWHRPLEQCMTIKIRYLMPLSGCYVPYIHAWAADHFWASVCRDTLRTRMKRSIPQFGNSALRSFSWEKTGVQTACVLAACCFNDRSSSLTAISDCLLLSISPLSKSILKRKDLKKESRKVSTRYPREQRSYED